MHKQGRRATHPNALRRAGTGAVALFVWALLAWEYTHGGIVVHHVLARDDLPALSNAWGGVVLPGLAWILLGRIQRRLVTNRAASGGADGRLGMIAGFVGAAVYGVVMSYCYVQGSADITSFLARALLPLALVLPIYRSEYVLGFVLAMAYTFGGILPVAFASLVALIAFVIHHGARWVLGAAGAFIRRRRGPAPSSR